MVKWMGPKTAFDAIHQCLLTFGHYGWSMDLPHQQRLRDVMGLEIGDGTAQIMKTIIARARGEAGNAGAGADWLYTYLRSFYRDENRPTGWNNVVFENVGMPHVLYGLQGQQVLNHETHKLELAVPGQLAPAEYDKAVSDLVSFMVWMGEPQQEFRRTLGIFVLAFLALLFVVSYALKKEYWKDIH